MAIGEVSRKRRGYHRHDHPHIHQCDHENHDHCVHHHHHDHQYDSHGHHHDHHLIECRSEKLVWGEEVETIQGTDQLIRILNFK